MFSSPTLLLFKDDDDEEEEEEEDEEEEEEEEEEEDEEDEDKEEVGAWEESLAALALEIFRLPFIADISPSRSSRICEILAKFTMVMWKGFTSRHVGRATFDVFL